MNKKQSVIRFKADRETAIAHAEATQEAATAPSYAALNAVYHIQEEAWEARRILINQYLKEGKSWE